MHIWIQKKAIYGPLWNTDFISFDKSESPTFYNTHSTNVTIQYCWKCSYLDQKCDHVVSIKQLFYLNWFLLLYCLLCKWLYIYIYIYKYMYTNQNNRKVKEKYCFIYFGILQMWHRYDDSIRCNKTTIIWNTSCENTTGIGF